MKYETWLIGACFKDGEQGVFAVLCNFDFALSFLHAAFPMTLLLHHFRL
jgi:hypothetical protein